MARIGLHQHRKFLRLAERLGSSALARGCLEMMWEPAYDSGDDFLGDAEDIWIRCGKPAGLGDGVLAATLLECGFIDEDPNEARRYRIHDFFIHAPHSVTKRAMREAERIGRGVTLSEVRAAAGRKGMKSRWNDNKRITSDNKRITNVATQYSIHNTQEALLRADKSDPPLFDIPAEKTKRPKGRPKKEPNPRHTPLKAQLFTAFREATGMDYGFHGARDAGGLAALLALSPDDAEIVSRWKSALGRSGFERPRDIPDFASKWNLYSLPPGAVAVKDVRKGTVRAEDQDYDTNQVDKHGNISF